MTNTRTVTCVNCGTSRFYYYQTLTEAARVYSFHEDGTAYVSDSKYEIVDVTNTEIRCENGHFLLADADNTGSGWNGECD
jgi:hypothetical protein